jgi:deoxyribodipyrimidine photolyase
VLRAWGDRRRNVGEAAWRDFFPALRAETARVDMRSREIAGAMTARREARGAATLSLVDAGMRESREGFTQPCASSPPFSRSTSIRLASRRAPFCGSRRRRRRGASSANVGQVPTRRPNRIFNLFQQARFDRRRVRSPLCPGPGVEGAAVHEPWKLGRRLPADYPDCIVDHDEAVVRFRAARRRAATA